MSLMEKLKITFQAGSYPDDNDPYSGVFVLQNGRKIGFIYQLGKKDWRVYGIDLGEKAYVFPFFMSAVQWVYAHKPGLIKASKARRLEETYKNMPE